MTNRLILSGLALVAVAAWAVPARAVSIFVPNGDFETPPPDPNVDGDNDYSTGDISPPWNGDNLRRNTNEAFTRPSTYALGWQSNGPADIDDGNVIDDGKFGLQQPRSGTGSNQLFYGRTQPAGTVPTGDLLAPFNGNLIGSVNMDDADGFMQEVQSVILGNLVPGNIYTLKVAVGGRANQNWNDIKYGISLVANPVNGDGTNSKHGSAGGTVLGTPTTQIVEVLGSVPDGSNIKDMTYVFTATTSDPFAIRITGENLLVQNGIPDPGGALVPPNYRFTQMNFDNVRLEMVPEPGSLGLAVLGMLAVGVRRRRA
jgi:hypothetical protein